MINNNSKSYDELYNYFLQFLNKYVEVYTFLSKSNIYGEVIEVTNLSIILSSKQKSDMYSSINEIYTYYLPISSIISIKEL